ncbi:uncharacterized protein LOC115890547 [Sitophilus oryzae]|uniref:Uncharacterized protein LOC115890547 n=1 Tax=Sitophilus oryzae TaxID=7048 RepID=A0A6J2YRH2_SITOR|nr:uncharacterized protein LOC115890547 [Sitophilus oryzae]
MGKKKNKKNKTPEPTGRTSPEHTGRLLMTELGYDIMKKYQENLSPSQRKVQLLFKEYRLDSYRRGYFLDQTKQDFILWSIRFLETNACFYLGMTTVIKELDILEYFETEVVSDLKCFIRDLHSLNLTVVCTLSPPGATYSRVIDILMENSLEQKRVKPPCQCHYKYDKRIYSDVISYEVSPVGSILHLYDLYDLMISLQETIKDHGDVYYLGYNLDDGKLRPHHADWLDVASMITSTKYRCCFFSTQYKISAVLFNVSCHFILKRIQQSEHLKMTPTMDSSIHLLETLCPLAQSIFHLRSVSPSDLEALYESLEDVRLILSSMVFKKPTDLTTSLKDLNFTPTAQRFPERPPTTLRVPEIPVISLGKPTPSTPKSEEVEKPEIKFSPNVKESTTIESTSLDNIYKDFIHHMKHVSGRKVPADKVKSMRSKRIEYVEKTLKTIKEQFSRNYEFVKSILSDNQSGKTKLPTNVVIDPLSPKPPSPANVEMEEEEEINREVPQDEAKIKKELWRMKKREKVEKQKKFDKLSRKQQKEFLKEEKRKRRPKPSTKHKFPGEEIRSVKSSTSAASISKSSTSTATSTTASQPLVSAASSSQSSTPVVKLSNFGDSDMNLSTSAAFVPQPSTSAAFVPQTSSSAAFVPQPSTSADFVPHPSTSAACSSTLSTPAASASNTSHNPSISAAEQGKLYRITYKPNAYRDKHQFCKLHNDIKCAQFERAPLDCLSTLKGFLALADILRMNNISNTETKVFCMEDLDYYFKFTFKKFVGLNTDALQFTVLRNIHISYISLIDREFHIPIIIPHDPPRLTRLQAFTPVQPYPSSPKREEEEAFLERVLRMRIPEVLPNVEENVEEEEEEIFV